MIEALGECDLRMTNQWNGIAALVSSNKDIKICEKTLQGFPSFIIIFFLFLFFFAWLEAKSKKEF